MDHELGIVFINFWANIWELKDIFNQNRGEPVSNYQNIPVSNYQNINLTNINASTLLNDTLDEATIFDLMEPDEIQNITTSNTESSMNTLSGK